MFAAGWNLLGLGYCFQRNYQVNPTRRTPQADSNSPVAFGQINLASKFQVKLFILSRNSSFAVFKSHDQMALVFKLESEGNARLYEDLRIRQWSLSFLGIMRVSTECRWCEDHPIASERGVGPVLLGTNQLLTINPAAVGPASIVLKPAPFTAGNSGVNVDKNNFAPIVGIAYTPRFAESIFGNDDTVIRAGFRVGYDDIFNNIPANMGLNAPYNLSTTQTAGVTQPGKFSYATGYNQNVPLVKFNAAGQPLVGLVGFSAEDPNIRSAYIYQYNIGIQRKFGQDMSFEVDYQGSTGHKLGLFVDYNQPQVIVNNLAVRGNQAPNVQIYPYPTFAGSRWQGHRQFELQRHGRHLQLAPPPHGSQARRKAISRKDVDDAMPSRLSPIP